MDESPLLIVVFGHENDRPDQPPGLSTVAQMRCTRAAEYIAAMPAAARIVVLLTGAFGDHFNTTPQPHHRILRSYFLDLPALKKRTGDLPTLGAPTSFTLEDVAYVRKVALEHGLTRIVLITSRFHEPRVQFYARKLLKDFEVDYASAEDPENLPQSVREGEQRKVDALNAGDWVDVPLPNKEYAFPSDVYDNAFEEHKHDDTVSYWLLAAAFSALIAPHLREVKSGTDFGAAGLMCGSCVIAYLLWRLYLRYADFARISRQSMRLLETIYFAPGFSYNHRRYFKNFRLNTPFNTRNVLGTLLGLLIATNALKGAILLGLLDGFR